MEEGILDINKVDFPVEDHGDVEIDPECCAPDYCRSGGFPGGQVVAKKPRMTQRDLYVQLALCHRPTCQ